MTKKARKKFTTVILILAVGGLLATTLLPFFAI